FWALNAIHEVSSSPAVMFFAARRSGETDFAWLANCSSMEKLVQPSPVIESEGSSWEEIGRSVCAPVCAATGRALGSPTPRGSQTPRTCESFSPTSPELNNSADSGEMCRSSPGGRTDAHLTREFDAGMGTEMHKKVSAPSSAAASRRTTVFVSYSHKNKRWLD